MPHLSYHVERARYVASHGGSKRGTDDAESNQRSRHNSNNTRVAPLHIYINSIIFTHIKCIVELFCADRRFSNQFPFISVYPYYHICVRTSIMG